MTWEDIFPILDESHVREYERVASSEDKARISGYFEVEEVISPGEYRRIVSTSLFFAPGNGVSLDEADLDEETLRSAFAKGLVHRYDPWKHYVEPLLSGAGRFRRKRADAGFRVYLGRNLRFLIPRLVDAGCEVHVMKSSSLGMQPGMMWRFLALEENDVEVTIVDADRARIAVEDSRRTTAAIRTGLGFWRLANFWHDSPYSYVPILGNQFGGMAEGWNVTKLASAFVWFREQGRFGGLRHPLTGQHIEAANNWSKWPEYGADEWFASVALFPLMARAGLLTIMSPEMPCFHWHALDVSFCVRSNDASEIVFSDIAAWRKPILLSERPMLYPDRK